MSLIESIRQKQIRKGLPAGETSPPHRPEMLYIGCIDARLDPINDIGIPKGTALIHRTIGAFVAGPGQQNYSEAATLEFAVRAMKVRDIVVSGHTNCGGIDACLHDHGEPERAHLRAYLKPLSALRDEVQSQQHDAGEHPKEMEEGAVRQSIENLMRYPFIREAVEQGSLRLHGWVIDTATQRLCEMDPHTGQFQPMSESRQDERLTSSN